MSGEMSGEKADPGQEIVTWGLEDGLVSGF